MTRNVKWSAEQQREWEAQEQAHQLELAAAASADEARIKLYRAVVRSARERPRLDPPADFASAVARRLREQEVDEAIERWLLGIGALIALVCALIYAAPTLLDARSPAQGALHSLSDLGLWFSSPWLWATALALAGAAVLDRFQERRGR
ncbi:MAG: hypothetical protein AB7E72_07725 [Lysobacterales bacterium]